MLKRRIVGVFRKILDLVISFKSKNEEKVIKIIGYDSKNILFVIFEVRLLLISVHEARWYITGSI